MGLVFTAPYFFQDSFRILLGAAVVKKQPTNYLRKVAEGVMAGLLD
jgi:hypothetical protein